MTLPLDGVAVLDLSRLLPGGLCSLLLSDFGADVTKVEEIASGDYMRWAGPRIPGNDRSATGAPFVALNRNKASLRVNLKTAQGREVLLRLAEGADVLLESFRPGVMERLGVGYEVLRTRNPGLVHCSITGYGKDGPWRDRAGHDLNYLGLVGVLALSGDGDGAPMQGATQLADVSGALLGAFGILVALRERERSGEGQHVDVSMADAALLSLAMDVASARADGRPRRRGEAALAGGALCYRPYRCADGWVTIGALEPKFWAAWCRGVDREDLIEHQFDPPGSAAHERVAAIFLARTRDEWQAFGGVHDCCVEPVLELEEALDSEHVRARDSLVKLAGGAEALGVPLTLSRTPGDPCRRPPPSLGEDTEAVLRAAGFGAMEVSELVHAGAVAGPGESDAPSFLSAGTDG